MRKTLSGIIHFHSKYAVKFVKILRSNFEAQITGKHKKDLTIVF